MTHQGPTEHVHPDARARLRATTSKRSPLNEHPARPGRRFGERSERASSVISWSPQASFSWAHDECAWFQHCRLPLEQKFQGDTYQTLRVAK